MNKILVPVLLVAVVALGAVVVLQQSKLTKMTLALADKPAAEVVERRVEVPMEKPVLVKEKVKSSDPKVSDEAEEAFQAALASAGDGAATKPAEKRGPDLVDLMKIVGSMMTNDAMKGMMRSQAEMQLEMQYGRLFKYLNLSPEKSAALKKLMADRQGDMMAEGMSFLEGGFNKENMEKRGKEMKARRDAFDKQIAELLGPDDYDVFKQYEDTQTERHEVELLKHQLAASGEPLSDQQESELVNRFHASRTNTPALRELMREDQVPDPEMFTGAGMTNVLTLMNRQQEQQATIARDVLTPAQYEQYARHAEQQRTMQQLGIQMAAQMFGGMTNALPVGVQVQTIVAP